ncbi:fumarylacetoacetate hydrolase family protein [Porticoccaceae bacterium]|nr:fumarylacetoacetate hydrolase family protein [Porticoccaceae bacterium]
MKIARLNDRAICLSAEGHFDIATSSSGRFPSDVDDLAQHWQELEAWLSDNNPNCTDTRGSNYFAKHLHELQAPLLKPRQIFAVGLNYPAHTAEVASAAPSSPVIFTKFSSSIAGPGDSVTLPPGGGVDWEVELVAVVSKGGRNISKEAALGAIGAYCVGQDLSERYGQMSGPAPQFSLAKSYAGFTPLGPWLTSSTAIENICELNLATLIDEEQMQTGCVDQMLFDLPTLIVYLSSIVELFPGDLIFTGTPDGVGMSRKPPRFLTAGETLHSSISQLGALRNPLL